MKSQSSIALRLFFGNSFWLYFLNSADSETGAIIFVNIYNQIQWNLLHQFYLQNLPNIIVPYLMYTCQLSTDIKILIVK